MSPVARGLIVAGLLLVALGLLWHLGGRLLPLGRLPGDIVVQRPGFRLYVPLATCVLASILLTLAIWIWRHLAR